MPKYIIKPNPEVDFYVDWSTIVEDAISWGDRKFMRKCGVEKERLERADQTGTSAYGQKDRSGEIWKQKGWLYYSQMEDFFTKLAELYPGDERIPENVLEIHPELWDYLEKFEDD
jgi:hypothetical protein